MEKKSFFALELNLLCRLSTKICGFVWSPVCFLVNSDAYLSEIGINRDIFEDFTAAATSLNMTVGLNLKTFVGNGNLP